MVSPFLPFPAETNPRLRTSWKWKEKSYLIAREPGSLASFDFHIFPPARPPVTSPTVNLVQEETPLPTEHKLNRFDPIPLGMRPGGPYNIHPIGVIDKANNGRKLGRQRARIMRQLERQEGGRVMIGYQRSATLGLGSVWCWVDDNRERGGMIEGYWDIKERNMGM